MERDYIKSNNEKKKKKSIFCFKFNNNRTFIPTVSRIFQNGMRTFSLSLFLFVFVYFFLYLFLLQIYYFFARLFTPFLFPSDLVRFYSSPFRFFHRAYLSFDTIFIREFEWIPFGKKKNLTALK